MSYTILMVLALVRVVVNIIRSHTAKHDHTAG